MERAGILSLYRLEIEGEEDPKENWTCDICGKPYRFFEVKQQLTFREDPDRKTKTVCAQCQKDIRREGRSVVEYH